MLMLIDWHFKTIDEAGRTGPPGFEPGQAGSKPAVLPLHHGPLATSMISWVGCLYQVREALLQGFVSPDPLRAQK